jgi:hypothetical protein
METELTNEHRKVAKEAIARHKEIERPYLHSFRCLCSDFPLGELQEPDPPAPDFVVVTEQQRRIGIELTQVFKADGRTKFSQQGIEAAKEEITVAARTYSECLSSPAAHVALFFSLQKHPNAKAREQIARQVAQVVHENMPPEGESVQLDRGIGGPRNQPNEVDLILINRVHPVDRHRWTWLEMGAEQTDVIELLERKIEEKARKLDGYLHHCDECWLLIVAPSFKPSGKIRPDEPTLSHSYHSPFARTYFLDFGHGTLDRLQDAGGIPLAQPPMAR